MIKSAIIQGLLCFFLLASGMAQANVQFDASRVVFDDANREQSFLLSNRNDYPVVVQAWVDDGALNSNAGFKGSPVITYPSIFKMDAHTNRSIRLINSAIGQKNAGTERLYWLNVQILSPKTGKELNTGKPELNVSLLLKFKLFYRPHALKGPSSEALKSMRFSRVGSTQDRLRISNPSPYYVTFNRLSDGDTPVLRDLMLPPGGSQELPLLAPLPASASGLNYAVVDDSGLITQGSVSLTK
ncbi:P pilus assembly chaperone PapD [Enterobacillus tribolii]|uniref:P pilus assembly chaperone PapD n=2 Tax=Enterobacillus tribolii TaxID=1487935 RepID=A0A370R2V1_9GAMM|nr:P pilus assembly chaperone PapD [Enterobacillus tribolii]